MVILILLLRGDGVGVTLLVSDPVSEGLFGLEEAPLSFSVTVSVDLLGLDFEGPLNILVEDRVLFLEDAGGTTCFFRMIGVCFTEAVEVSLDLLLCLVDDKSHFFLVAWLTGAVKDSGTREVYLVVHHERYPSVTERGSIETGFLKRLACSDSSRRAKK